MLFYRQKHDHQPVADTLQNIGGAVNKSYMAANLQFYLSRRCLVVLFNSHTMCCPYRNYWAHTEIIEHIHFLFEVDALMI